MIRQSFTLRVLAISFIVLALPLLIDSFIFFQHSYNEAIKQAKAQLKEAANFRALTVGEIQPVKPVLLKELGYLLNLKNLDQKDLNKELSEISQMGGGFQVFILDQGTDSKYKILASNDASKVDDVFVSHLRLNEILKKGEGSFIRYVYSDLLGEYVPYIFVARVISSEKGGVILMVASDIQAELNYVLSDKQKFRNIYFAILNNDGVVFGATESSLIGEFFDPMTSKRQKDVFDTVLTKKLPQNALVEIKGEDPPFFEFIFDDEVQIGYRSYIPETGISVVAYSAKEEFFAAAVRHFLFIYVLYGLILVIGGGITYWLSIWISRPLRQLSYLMGEVSQGNLDVRFHKERFGFEINILGGIFNHTLDNLLENIQHAEDERVVKEVYERELDIGRQVQRNLIPQTLPQIQGAELASEYLSAKEVGGDFYGYLLKTLKSGEEALFFGVADAAGVGISSCLYSLSTRSLVRSNITLYDDVGEILSRTNNAFLEDVGESGMFVTYLLGCYHTQSRILSYYSCGHVPGLLRRSSGQIEVLEHEGIALGLQYSEGYKSHSIQLESGDIVIFFTDGLIEAMNFDRVRHILQNQSWNRAQDVVDGLIAELSSFTHNIPQTEEVCIVALKVT